MDAVEAAGGAHAQNDPRKPVALVLVGYVATVFLPTIGFLFGVVALSRPGRWAKRQGVLILVLALVLVTFGIALLPMLTDSYFAGKAKSELNQVSKETEQAERVSRARLRTELARIHKEEVVTEAEIRRFREQHGR
jgi:Sec-independent protein translocase protein TatA